MLEPESTVAAVGGQVWSSRGERELAPGRCIIDRDGIAFDLEGGRTSVAYDDVRDVSQGWAPEGIAHVAEDILTVSFVDGDSRELASIAGDRGDVDRLAAILFRMVLDTFDVIVGHPAWTDEQRHLTPPERATLRAPGDVLRIVRPNDQVDLDLDAITGYERVASGRYGGLPTTIGVYHAEGESTIRTDVTFTAGAEVNLFGRFLAERAGAELVANSSIRALIVDDEPGLAEMIADLMEAENEGYSFIPLTGPLEAIEYLSENPRIDCIVSDFKMDEMDGIEFLKLVRQVRPEMPFILLTGRGSEEVAEEALGTGATDYIRKETLHEQTEEIAERVERAVARTRPHLIRE